MLRSMVNNVFLVQVLTVFFANDPVLTLSAPYVMFWRQHGTFDEAGRRWTFSNLQAIGTSRCSRSNFRTLCSLEMPKTTIYWTTRSSWRKRIRVIILKVHFRWYVDGRGWKVLCGKGDSLTEFEKSQTELFCKRAKHPLLRAIWCVQWRRYLHEGTRRPDLTRKISLACLVPQ